MKKQIPQEAYYLKYMCEAVAMESFRLVIILRMRRRTATMQAARHTWPAHSFRAVLMQAIISL